MTLDRRRLLRMIRAMARDVARARADFEERRRRDYVALGAELRLLEQRVVRGFLAPGAAVRALVALADASVALGASAHWRTTARRLAEARRAA